MVLLTLHKLINYKLPAHMSLVPRHFSLRSKVDCVLPTLAKWRRGRGRAEENFGPSGKVRL